MRVIKPSLVVLMCFVAQSVAATPFKECVATYKRKDYATAFTICRPLAERGDALAQNLLGVMYQHGQGVRVNYAKALKWIRKSARQGNAAARNNLGVMYRYGTGVQRNYSKALYWFRKSAVTGNATGQVNLGHAYQNGRGVRKSYVKAYMWYILAIQSASNNFEAGLARSNRNIVARRMTRTKIAEAQYLARKCHHQRYKNC